MSSDRNGFSMKLAMLFFRFNFFLCLCICDSTSFTFTTPVRIRKPTMISESRLDGLPSDEILDKVLKVAIDASKKAGDIILGNAGGADVTKCKANSRDLLTLIDPMCEKVR